MQSVDDIKNHRVHGAVEKLTTKIGAIQKDSIDKIRARQRLLGLSNFLKVNINKSEPQLVPEGLFESVLNDVSVAIDNLDQFYASSEFQFLDQVANSVSQACRKIPAPFYSRYASLNTLHLERFQDSVDEITSDLEGRASSASKSISQLEADLAGLNDKLAASEARVTEVIEGLNTQFAESQAQRRSEMASLLEDVQNKVDQAVAGFNSNAQGRVSGFESEVSQLFERAEEMERDFEQAQKDREEQFNAQSKKIGVELDAVRSDVNEKREHIRELYNLTGDDATVGGYQGQAAEEENAANWLRIVAISLMILSSIVLITPYLIQIFRGDYLAFEWSHIFERLPLSTLLLVPALYAARESGKHRSLARDFRVIQLQISTLDPFISKLPESKKKEIKEELVDVYFAGAPKEEKNWNANRNSIVF